MEKKYLNEEKYQKNKKTIMFVAVSVLIIGILIGGALIATGIMKQFKVNSQYSEDSKLSLSEQLSNEKSALETKKAELESRGIKYDGFAEYTDGEVYHLYLITKVLDPSLNSCTWDEYKNSDLTSKYCSLKNNLEDMNSDFNKKSDSVDSISFYMSGAFVIIASFMISGPIFMFAKTREILAFSAQQVVPVGKEVIDEMAPTIGNAFGEVSKGIKKGLKDEEE